MVLTKLPLKLKKLFLVCFILTGVVTLLFLVDYKKTTTLQNTPKTFVAAVGECNFTTKHLRFSCYRSTIENFFQSDTAKFSNYLKTEKELSFDNRSPNLGEVDYAIFGTSCHTFYHAAGDFIAVHATTADLKTLLDMGVGKCTAAYTMGLYKRLALKDHYSTGLLKEFIALCPVGQENQCSHEVGHLVHDKYTYSLLKIIDETTYKNYGLKQDQGYEYTTYPDKKSNLDAPFEECETIIAPEKTNLIAQCYTGIGHNMFVFTEFSPDGYSSQFNECDNITENKNNCYAFLLYRIGINEGSAKLLSNNAAGSNKVCTDAVALIKRNDLAYHCFLGIGGGIGLWLDSQYSGVKIDENNLVAVKADFLKNAQLCEKLPANYLTNCFAGLMGTKFAKYFKDLGISYPTLEEIIPSLDSPFEVVG